MQELKRWPLEDRRAVRGVLTDIDDTLTTDGAITPDALAALSDLQQAGLPVIAVTGRPVGWSEQLALHWPLTGIVAENGAVLLHPSDSTEMTRLEHRIDLQPNQNGRKQLSKRYQQSDTERSFNRTRMQRVVAQIGRALPQSRQSTDSAGRETDIAIDHSEFSSLTEPQIAQVLQIMRSQGMRATVSSIHVNGWFGPHDKLQGARWAVRELLGRDLEAEVRQWLFVGDSTNDELMFGAFPQSVGVANVRRFEPQLRQLPRYIAQAERGAGFAEVVAALLTAHEGAVRVPGQR